MLPPRPSPRRDDLEKRVSGAFAMMHGGEAPPDAGHDAGAEAQEDELLQELERALQAAEQVLQKLRAAQAHEKGDGEGGAKIDDDSSTGSPSMQGTP